MFLVKINVFLVTLFLYKNYRRFRIWSSFCLYFITFEDKLFFLTLSISIKSIKLHIFHHGINPKKFLLVLYFLRLLQSINQSINQPVTRICVLCTRNYCKRSQLPSVRWKGKK